MIVLVLIMQKERRLVEKFLCYECKSLERTYSDQDIES